MIRSTPVVGPYLVTDTALSGERGVLEVIRAAVAGGIRTVQIRDKTASGRSLCELVTAAGRITKGRALLLVDDRVDVYLAVRASGGDVAGVHLGQGDLPVSAARAVIGPDAVLGLTANTSEQLRKIGELPPGTVDYLGVGVIRPTATKPDHPAPLGVSGFARIASATRLPCVAIGGIVLDDVAGLRAAGAAGVAVVSAICAAPDPESAARAFTDTWDSANPTTADTSSRAVVR
ncbi:thiamine phosphate synthase [Rathayibacter sp. CAU 1779]